MGGQITVKDKHGEQHPVGGECIVATMHTLVGDDRLDRYDLRPDNVRRGSLTVAGMSVQEARELAGRRVAIFLIEE